MDETRSEALEVCVHLEPISPELVLVDPALARPARALLPLPGDFRPGWWTRLALLPAEPEPDPAPEPEPVVVAPAVEPARAPRRRARRALVALAFAATTGAAFVVGYAAGDRDGSAPVTRVAAAADDPPAEVATTAPTTEPTTTVQAEKPAVTTPAHAAPKPAPKQPPHTAPRPKPKSAATTTTLPRPPRRAPARTTATTQPAPSTTAPTTPTKPTKPPAAPARFVPARTWMWVPVPGATAYRVTFERGGRTFFRATRRIPRVDLPASLKFAPGRYTWRVVPVVGGRPGKAIVDSSFTVR